MQQEKEAERKTKNKKELHEINEYNDFWNLKNMYKMEDKVKKIFQRSYQKETEMEKAKVFTCIFFLFM